MNIFSAYRDSINTVVQVIHHKKIWISKNLPGQQPNAKAVFYHGVLILIFADFFSSVKANPIRSDYSLPTPSQLTCSSNICQINQGTLIENNLFHSFSEFSLPRGGEAYFNNSQTVQNIISRVTGTSISNINGLIRANGNANLFLINPNGVTFGSDTRLDIGGSFLATTASAIKFADGSLFSAATAQTQPLLTLSIPVGLQFGATPGSITVQGRGTGIRISTDLIDTNEALRVQPNQTLALVGGDITLVGGTLKTAGGRIELGSVGDGSFVSINPTNNGWSLGYDSVSVFKDIQLSNSAVADASGLGGGSIQVQGRRVTLRDGSQIEASTLGSQPGQGLILKAKEALELSGSTADGQFVSSLQAHVYSGATGTGGDISIETQQLIARDGGSIYASTSHLGAAGNLAIAASEKVELIGTTGDSQTPSGLFSLVYQGATGSGGNLTLNTKKLTVRDGAQISAATFGQGSGGIIAVTALDAVELSGKPRNGNFVSGLFTSAQPGSTGTSGSISVTTGQLLIQDQAKVTVSSPTSAQAGNVLVAANSLFFNNQGKLIAETAAADGGNIRIQGANLILMRGNSLISATAGGLGNGGNLDINSQFLVAIPQENNDIIANAFQGRGGTIQIAAKSIFGLQYRQHQTSASDITASSKFGTSGTVLLNTPTVDPTQGLINLSTNLVNAEALVGQGCKASEGSQSSRLIVTGKGGLPANPNETLNSETVLVDLGSTLPPKSQAVTSLDEKPKSHVALVEAQGWVTNANGQIILTANVPLATPHNSWHTPTKCSR